LAWNIPFAARIGEGSSSFFLTALRHLTTNRSGSGPLPVTFAGTINQPAAVTVSADTNQITGTTWAPTTSQSSDVFSNGQAFADTIDLPPGLYGVPVGSSTSTPYVPPIQIVAQSGAYYATNTYNLTVSGDAWKSYGYDPDGNCTNMSMAGTNTTYQWDAENRLVAINEYVTNTAALFSTKFAYDGLDRWCQIIEISNGVAESTQRFVWCGTELCQARDGSDNVTRQFFADGEQINGTNYYYQKDHLGTIWSLTDSSGIIRTTNNYDPYGQEIELGGSVTADFGFAGMYVHQPSGLNLTLYRAYDPSSGRWLNRDPIGENGGLNLYDYVENDPLNNTDPFGLVLDPGDTELLADPTLIMNNADAAEYRAAQAVKKAAEKAIEKAEKEAAQCRRLSDGEIKKLKNAGHDIHDLKPNSDFDLFKNRNGDIFVKPKSGIGPGDPTGININNP
jgi:RHS repeat-associated protein